MQRTAFGLFVALAFSVVAPLASAETTSAVATFEKDLMLAKEGDVDAQLRLGSRYVKGEGVPIGVMKAMAGTDGRPTRGMLSPSSTFR